MMQLVVSIILFYGAIFTACSILTGAMPTVFFEAACSTGNQQAILFQSSLTAVFNSSVLALLMHAVLKDIFKLMLAATGDLMCLLGQKNKGLACGGLYGITEVVVSVQRCHFSSGNVLEAFSDRCSFSTCTDGHTFVLIVAF